MSVQIVLQLGDIEGETIVTDEDGTLVPKGIDCVSWSWGMVQKGSARYGSGGGSGAADVDNLVITKRVDKASPNIYKACLLGTTIKGDAVLRCFKIGGGTDPNKVLKVEYVNIKMTGVVQIARVSSGQLEMANGQSTDLFLETVELHFSQVEITYKPQIEDNTGASAVQSGTLPIGT